LPDAIAFAKIIASRPPLAVANIRKAMYEGLNMSLKEGLKLEWQLQMQLFASDDAQRLMKQYVAGGQNAELMRRELPPI
jgi:enoyl-CoA hydratase/carnithine racemase